MPTAEPFPVYEEFLDLFVDSIDIERLLAFRLPEDKAARLDDLLQKNRDGLLTETERGELAEFERLEHLGRLLRARSRRVR